MEILLIVGVLIWLSVLSNRVSNIERGLRSGTKEESKPLFNQLLENAEPVGQESTKPPEIKEESEPASGTQYPGSAPLETTPTLSQTRQDQELEFKMGSRVLTGVGVVAVLFGVGFFLRYAFAHNLITETMRVALGIIGGFILIGIGAAIHRAYTQYAQALSGGGIGLLYLSLYAAFNYYHLIIQPVAFAMMIAVTVLCIALALFYDSLPLAGFALFGGFLTPFILPVQAPDPHSLFIYVFLLDIGFFVVAWRKLWHQLSIASFAGTILVYAAWYLQNYSSALFDVSIIYSTLFFLLFFVLSLYYQQSEFQSRSSMELIFANPILYYLGNIFEIHRLYGNDWATMFTVVLGVFYLTMAFISSGVFKQSIRSFSNQVLLGISLVFLVVAVPIYFDKNIITIMWGAEACVLLLIGLFSRMRIARLFGFAVSALVLVRLIAFDLTISVTTPWFNDRVFTYALSFIFFGVVATAHWLYQNTAQATSLSSEERDEIQLVIFYSTIIAYLISLTMISLEIFNFYDHAIFGILWSLWALCGVALGVASRNSILRFCSYVVFVLAGIRVIFLDGTVNLSLYTPILNGRVFRTLILVATLGCILWLIAKFADRLSQSEVPNLKQFIALAVNGILLWVISVEVIDYFDKLIMELPRNTVSGGATTLMRVDAYNSTKNLENFKSACLSMAWTLYAIVLLIVGIYRKSKVARIGSIVLFGIVVFKVFLIDTASLDDLYRFISFISLGVILLVAGFLYYRFKDRIIHFLDASV